MIPEYRHNALNRHNGLHWAIDPSAPAADRSRYSRVERMGTSSNSVAGRSELRPMIHHPERDPVKAITLAQPHASLVALGVKTMLDTSWPTDYRGRLAVHAGARVPSPERGPMFVGDYHVAQGGTWLHGGEHNVRLPFAAIVATCEVLDVVPIVAGNCGPTPRLATCADGALVMVQAIVADTRDVTDQRLYGDFTPGRYAWILGDVQPTTSRCPACWGTGWRCDTHQRGACDECTDSHSGCRFCTPVGGCGGTGSCPPIPARGRGRLWEWAE